MNIDNRYKQCKRCLMDTTASDITFDESGVCNYCTEFLQRSSHLINENPNIKELRLKALVERIKLDGKGKLYDCIVGVSGGVDSSWTLVEVKRLGLRPLAVHMDNGWNSELAQNNIANLIKKLNVDLYTHVIDWDEYRGLMQAFFDADVIDVELLYDNAMLAVNYKLASKFNIKYILSGSNLATEGMRIPSGWSWFKFDKKNIVSLYKRSGGLKLKTFPAIGTMAFIWYQYFKSIRWVSFLDYTEYNKFDVLNRLERDYGYRRYPFKHYESIFTRFYQGYILPRKFAVDKRLLHYSTLIVSGQMNRSDALNGMQGIPYPSEQELNSDVDYFLKKMKWSKEDLAAYISRGEVLHSAYPSERGLWNFFKKIYQKFN
jgi:N-acetyl sugar amidotransferase